jgi:hypothetical protein
MRQDHLENGSGRFHEFNPQSFTPHFQRGRALVSAQLDIRPGWKNDARTPGVLSLV